MHLDGRMGASELRVLQLWNNDRREGELDPEIHGGEESQPFGAVLRVQAVGRVDQVRSVGVQPVFPLRMRSIERLSDPSEQGGVLPVPPSVEFSVWSGRGEVVQPVFPAGRAVRRAQRGSVGGADGGERVGAVHDAVQPPRGVPAAAVRVPVGRAAQPESGARSDSNGESDGVARGFGGRFAADAHGAVRVPRPVPRVPRVLEREASGDANAVLSGDPRGGGGRGPGASPRVQHQRRAVGGAVLLGGHREWARRRGET